MSLDANDRLEILDLVARYNLNTDNRDVDGFMSCWAEEIRFESPFGTFDTREALRAFEDQHVNGGGAAGKRHISTNVSIEPGEQDDEAFVTSDLGVLDVVELPRVVATALRSTLVVRTDGGWKFAQRRLVVGRSPPRGGHDPRPPTATGLPRRWPPAMVSSGAAPSVTEP